MENGIIIREMHKSDLEESLILWKAAFKAGFSSEFDKISMLESYLDRNPNFSSVAYDANGSLIGALLCGHDGRRGSIYHTAVSKTHRGLGIGHLMEVRSTNELKKIGITTGFLFINVNNPGSKEFWKKTGWELIEDIRYLYKEF